MFKFSMDIEEIEQKLDKLEEQYEKLVDFLRQCELRHKVDIDEALEDEIDFDDEFDDLEDQEDEDNEEMLIDNKEELSTTTESKIL